MAGVNKTVEQIVFEGVDKISGVTKQAQSSVNQLRQSVDSVKGALAAVGVTVGAGAMISLYYDTLKAVAALDNMAEATGASVEGLSAIQRVAKVGGHDFEGLTGQIGRMIKGLKDGGEEGTKTTNALKQLGISTRDAGGQWRDTSEIIVDLAVKLDRYKDGISKTQAVQDVLGKGSERYIPLLKDMAEKTDLHATVTAKQAAQAEEAEKNIKRLTLAMEDSRRELVVQYTPSIIEFTEKLIAATRAMGGLGGGIALMLMQPLGKSADERLKEVTEELELRTRGAAKNPRIAASIFGVEGPIGGTRTMMLEREKEYLQAVIKLREDAANKIAAADPKSQLFEFGGQPKPELDYKGLVDLKAQQKREEEVRDAIHKAGEARDALELKQIEFQNKRKEDLENAHLKAEEDIAAKSAALIISGRAGEEEQLATRGPRGDVTGQLDALRQMYGSQEQLAEEAHARKRERLQQFNDEELELLGGRQAIEEQMESEHQAQLLDIELKKNQVQRSMQIGTWQLGAELLQSMAGKSKLAAIASIAITKALAIARVIQETAVARMAVMADPTILWPAKPAAIAAVETMGAIQLGLIAATGLIQAAGVGGGGAAAGSPANPVSTTGGGLGFSQAPAPVAPVVVNLSVTGVVTQSVIDQMIAQLKDAIGNSDAIIIPQNSRQAADIAALA